MTGEASHQLSLLLYNTYSTASTSCASYDWSERSSTLGSPWLLVDRLLLGADAAGVLMRPRRIRPASGVLRFFCGLFDLLGTHGRSLATGSITALTRIAGGTFTAVVSGSLSMRASARSSLRIPPIGGTESTV